MIRNVESVKFNIVNRNNTHNGLKNDIDKCWEEFHKNNPNSFNGDVLSAFDIDDDNCVINMEWIKFADVVYGKNGGNLKTRSLFSGGYIITNDNYIGIVLDYKNILNLIGGMASKDDFFNGEYRSELCLIRETKEELGIDIKDDKFSFNLKYLKYPKDDEDMKFYYTVGLLYEIKTSYSREEIENLFKTQKHDHEINSLIFFKPSEYNVLKNYQKRDYLFELFELISKDYE